MSESTQSRVMRRIRGRSPLGSAIVCVLCGILGGLRAVQAQVLDGNIEDITECRIVDSFPDNQGQRGLQDDPLSFRCAPAGEGNNPSGMNIGALRVQLDAAGAGTLFIGIELDPGSAFDPGRIPFDVDFDGDVDDVSPIVAFLPDCIIDDRGLEQYVLFLDVGLDGNDDIVFLLESNNGILPREVTLLQGRGHSSRDFGFSLGPIIDGNPQGMPEFAIANYFLTRDPTGATIPLCDFSRLGVFALAIAAADSSEEDVLIGECDFPLVDSCATGTVNAARGTIADVLFVNGRSSDDGARVLLLDQNGPLEIELGRPPAAAEGTESLFALYLWDEWPNCETLRLLPLGIGLTCMPTPLGGEGPRIVWNNTGKSALGSPRLPSRPAPAVVLSRKRIGRSGRFFLQGIVADPGSTARRPASVTNGIGLDVR